MVGLVPSGNIRRHCHEANGKGLLMLHMIPDMFKRGSPSESTDFLAHRKDLELV